ncbi:MAG: prolipoprotein diacylglyceryl transferase [Gammaproteobacteria bacterium]|nr:prolipoprotein diacylglyceryl transferase [Gammaproteobacteria bacterium]
MIIYPEIDPVLIAIGPIQLHWYGMMYLCAFAAAWWLGRYRASQIPNFLNEKQIEDMIFYGAMGVILGGRMGYVFFYNFDHLLSNPLYLFKIWEGGMSFHGGFLGVLAAMEIYRRKVNLSFFQLMDFVAPLVPLGLGFGRIANFINGELWGAPSTQPWAMKMSCEAFPPERFYDFAGALCETPRHPSQLYEFALEGVVLFIILWLYSKKQRPVMAVSGMFLIGYGVFRSLVEAVRLPDAHIGYLMQTTWLTKGIILSLPMIVVGIILMKIAYKKETVNEAS